MSGWNFPICFSFNTRRVLQLDFPYCITNDLRHSARNPRILTILQIIKKSSYVTLVGTLTLPLYVCVWMTLSYLTFTLLLTDVSTVRLGAEYTVHIEYYCIF